MFLKLDFILSFEGGRFFRKWPTDIFKAVCMVVPSIFSTVNSVGAISNIFGLCAETFS